MPRSPRTRYSNSCTRTSDGTRLSRKVGAVSLEELVDRIAHREGNPTGDRLEQIAVEFHHNHLRKLVDSKVLRYDADAGTIERRAAARSLDPYLELAFTTDL